jgi:hypothetical protein
MPNNASTQNNNKKALIGNDFAIIVYNDRYHHIRELCFPCPFIDTAWTAGHPFPASPLPRLSLLWRLL